MDFPTVILQWRERPLEQWLAAGNRFLPQAASIVLIVGIAYAAARLTWTLAPGEPVDGNLPALTAPAAPGGTTAGVGTLDVAPVIEAHLFGETERAPAPVVETVVDAPDTTLSLRLTAVISGENSETGLAIIDAGRGDAKVYVVGEAIDNTGGASLHAVYDDRVLLNRAGRLETLRLPKERGPQLAGRLAPRMPVTPADNSLRQVISENATRLNEVIRVAPFIDQGQMVGFRLNPAQDRALFESLGLQPNDVVTEINGTMLNDPSAGLQVFESLGEATQANVTVIRNGSPEVLVIDTTQLQQLAEGRQ